jgi:hypothetical protein
MPRLIPFILLFSACATVPASFKQCAKQAAAKGVEPAVASAMSCGQDQSCLKLDAEHTAILVADELAGCAAQLQADGGNN